jgi:heat shock protein HtpX
MHTHRFPRDSGLTFRMVLVMFLLGLLYVVFISVLLAAKVDTAFVIVLAVGLLFAQYYFSDRIALFAMHAKEVTPQQQPALHAIVDRLCALADMPKPRIAIADSDMPNAFATGRNQKNAVVCATTGIMRRLDESELEAVLAHELAHVAHRDVAVMTIASGLGMIAGLITRFTLYSGMYGGGYGRGGGRDRDGGSPILVIILVSAIVYAVSFLLIRALSRYRELAADRGGAAITGAPSKLAAALVKVSGEIGRIPSRDLRAAEPFNAFFFAPAIASGFSLSSLFSTHPSLEQRLDQLSRIEAELGHG